MSMLFKEEKINSVDQILVSTISQIVKDKYALTPEDGIIMVEIPKDTSNGDYSTNVAMRLTKVLGRKPQEIASELKEELLKNVMISNLLILRVLAL